MGEVYRARDTELHRDVAIKVVPEAFAQDAERLARFTREAQTLASLNPPNIALIYEMTSGVFSGVVPTEKIPDVISHGLVMELLEGETLRDKISPDGSRATSVVTTPLRINIWLADWTRDTWSVCRECAIDGLKHPVWSPEGDRLLLARNDTLVVHTLDGSAPDQVLVQEHGRSLLPGQWLTDGRIVYQSSPDLIGVESKLLEPGGHTGRVIVPLGDGMAPEVSPDGRWLAYQSDGQVMVQAFPGPGSRAQISAGATSTNPLWSPDSRTLYYLRRTETAGSAIIAVDIAASPGLVAGKARELFRSPQSQSCAFSRCYAISLDGTRFLLRELTAVLPTPVTRMDLVTHWATTLRGGT